MLSNKLLQYFSGLIQHKFISCLCKFCFRVAVQGNNLAFQDFQSYATFFLIGISIIGAAKEENTQSRTGPLSSSTRKWNISCLLTFIYKNKLCHFT